MLRFVFLGAILLPFSVHADESIESLYLKILVKREAQVSELESKIHAMESDISRTNQLLEQLLARQGGGTQLHQGKPAQTPSFELKNGKFEQRASISDEPSTQMPMMLASRHTDLPDVFIPKTPDFREGFFTEAAPFYARRNVSQVAVASTVNGFNFVKKHAFSDDFNPGGTLSFGYRDQDDWSMKIEGTYYQDDDKISARTSGSHSFVPANLLGIKDDFAALDFSNLTAKNDFDLIRVNFLAGKSFDIGTKGEIEPFGGLSFAHIKNDQELGLFNNNLSSSFTSKSKQTMTAAGPVLGVYGQYKVFNDIYFFGKSSFSTLFGKNDLKLKGSFVESGAPANNRTRHASKSEFDSFFNTSNEIGLGWDLARTAKTGLGIKFSYFYENWFDLDQSFKFDTGSSDAPLPSQIHKKNVTLDGVKLNLIGYW